MGQAHEKQSDVIRNTVKINEEIAGSIKQENTEFSSINDMVENNTKDVAQMTEQVSALNQMAEQMNHLLAGKKQYLSWIEKEAGRGDPPSC